MGGGISKGFEEMQKNQKKTMLESQERMRRVMLAQQVAIARDRVDWMLGAWASAALAGSVATLRGVKLPPAAAAPFLVYTVVLAYQWDFAYGNKTERINNTFNRIVNTEKHWFLPFDTKSIPGDVDRESNEERADITIKVVHEDKTANRIASNTPPPSSTSENNKQQK